MVEEMSRLDGKPYRVFNFSASESDKRGTAEQWIQDRKQAVKMTPLVADQFAATVGEDRRQAGQARRHSWLLLAESHLTRRLFGSMVRRIVVLPLPTG